MCPRGRWDLRAVWVQTTLLQSQAVYQREHRHLDMDQRRAPELNSLPWLSHPKRRKYWCNFTSSSGILWSSSILHLLFASWEGTTLTLKRSAMTLPAWHKRDWVKQTFLFYSVQWYDRRYICKNWRKKLCMFLYKVYTCIAELPMEYELISSTFPSIFFLVFLTAFFNTLKQVDLGLTWGCGHSWCLWSPTHPFLSPPQKSKLESIE